MKSQQSDYYGVDIYYILPEEDKASCTSKEQCGRDDIYDIYSI